MRDLPGWLARLEPAVPDLVAPFRALEQLAGLAAGLAAGSTAGPTVGLGAPEVAE